MEKISEILMTCAIVVQLSVISAYDFVSKAVTGYKPLPLVAEIEAFRKTNREANADITPLLSQHIAVGSTIEEAKAYLESQGFKTSYGQDSQTHRKFLSASRKQDHPKLFDDEYQIYVFFEDSKVSEILARIYTATF